MNTHRLLIVEDDPALLRGVADNFAARGYHVETASDGERGLDKRVASSSTSPSLM